MTKLHLTPSPYHTAQRSKKAGSYLKEHESQRSVLDWAKWHESRYPELRMLFAVPNGAVAGPGRFAIVTWMKSLGMKNGVPDLFLPVTRLYQGRCLPGLWIEMKIPGGELTQMNPETGEWGQEEWRDALIAQGYRHRVCDDSERAKLELLTYVQLPKYYVEEQDGAL